MSMAPRTTAFSRQCRTASYRWAWSVAVLLFSASAINYLGPSPRAEYPFPTALEEDVEEDVDEDKARAAAGAARQARRDAESRLLEKNRKAILGLVEKADAARASGDRAKALALYQKALRSTPRNNELDFKIREQAIYLALFQEEVPPVPREARRHFNRSIAFIKASRWNRDFFRKEFYPAIDELELALLVAPWWDKAYFNLAVAQEKTEDFRESIGNFKLYLVTAPKAKDRTKVQNKLDQLEVFDELQSSRSRSESR